jgi:site-specific DNA-adenine methylase
VKRIIELVYPGGKNSGGAYQKIICQIPPHDTYIEPFLGSGAVMRMKRPARVNIGLDLDSGVVEVFNCGRAQSQLAASATVVKVGCGLEFLRSYEWQGSEFVYCDPPYIRSSRRQRGAIYLHEMTEADHKHLLAIIKLIPAPVAISGYASSLYEYELKGWRVIEWQAITRGGSMATEYLWMNYPEPVELHDYGYLGENRTDRQRIKRKIQCWKNKLASMPVLERQALLAALEKMK